MISRDASYSQLTLVTFTQTIRHTQWLYPPLRKIQQRSKITVKDITFSSKTDILEDPTQSTFNHITRYHSSRCNMVKEHGLSNNKVGNKETDRSNAALCWCLCCLRLDKVLVLECCRTLHCTGFKCAQRRLTAECVCVHLWVKERKNKAHSAFYGKTNKGRMVIPVLLW